MHYTTRIRAALPRKGESVNHNLSSVEIHKSITKERRTEVPNQGPSSMSASIPLRNVVRGQDGCESVSIHKTAY